MPHIPTSRQTSADGSTSQAGEKNTRLACTAGSSRTSAGSTPATATSARRAAVHARARSLASASHAACAAMSGQAST